MIVGWAPPCTRSLIKSSGRTIENFRTTFDTPGAMWAITIKETSISINNIENKSVNQKGIGDIPFNRLAKFSATEVKYPEKRLQSHIERSHFWLNKSSLMLEYQRSFWTSTGCLRENVMVSNTLSISVRIFRKRCLAYALCHSAHQRLNVKTHYIRLSCEYKGLVPLDTELKLDVIDMAHMSYIRAKMTIFNLELWLLCGDFVFFFFICFVLGAAHKPHWLKNSNWFLNLPLEYIGERKTRQNVRFISENIVKSSINERLRFFSVGYMCFFLILLCRYGTSIISAVKIHH